MIEGSRSIHRTSESGSGSRRPKNIWIRIRNTASYLLWGRLKRLSEEAGGWIAKLWMEPFPSCWMCGLQRIYSPGWNLQIFTLTEQHSTTSVHTSINISLAFAFFSCICWLFRFHILKLIMIQKAFLHPPKNVKTSFFIFIYGIISKLKVVVATIFLKTKLWAFCRKFVLFYDVKIKSSLSFCAPQSPLLPPQLCRACVLFLCVKSRRPPSPPLHCTMVYLKGQSPEFPFVHRSSLYRSKEQRLTRDAMKKYLRERGDMVVVMLHAKVQLKGQ